MILNSAWLDLQNSSEAQTALGAADFWWGSAQRFRAVQLALVVLLPTILAVAAQFYSALVVIAGFIGFVLTFVDTVVIYPYLSSLRRRAAQAQDIFDAQALGIPRSMFRHSCDPDATDLREAFNKQNPTRAERNPNWYTVVLGGLPQPVGIIACMLESAAWDGGLRERYCNAIFGCGVVAVLIVVAYALFGPHRGEVVERILFPLMPAIVWGGREFWDQKEASRAVTRIREALQRIWEDVIANNLTVQALDAAAVDMASAFFAYRSGTPPAPHKLYTILRARQTASLEQVAIERVESYNNRHRKM